MQRTFTPDQSGPIALDLALSVGDITVFTDDRDVATVTVEPVDPTNDHEADALVHEALDTTTDDGLRVSVPRPLNTVGTTHRSHQAADVDGIVLNSGGAVVIGGQVVDEGHRLHRANGAVRIAAWLPENSSVHVRTDSAQMRTDGPLRWVSYRSKSGDLDVDSVGELEAATLSGNVKVGDAGETTTSTTSGNLNIERAARFNARSVSGDVAVRELTDQGTAQTTSGDVNVRAVSDSTVTASTVSGDIRLSARPGVDLNASTHTVSGHIQHPDIRAV